MQYTVVRPVTSNVDIQGVRALLVCGLAAAPVKFDTVVEVVGGFTYSASIWHKSSKKSMIYPICATGVSFSSDDLRVFALS